jgi:hypothetical protein
MKETEQTMPTRRRWLGAIGTALGLAGLGACSERSDRPPAIPYGQALDVTRAGTFVEFDFRIDKPDRYDVLLEVFKKDNKEHLPREVWDTPNAHFKVRIQSLAAGGEVLVEREVGKVEGRLLGKGFGPSSTESTKLMSFLKYLIKEHPLGQGSYRVRVDSINPILALQGRLVKVSIERMHYPK